MKRITLIAALISFNTFSSSLDDLERCAEKVYLENSELIVKVQNTGDQLYEDVPEEIVSKFGDKYDKKIHPAKMSCEDLINDYNASMQKLIDAYKEVEKLIN